MIAILFAILLFLAVKYNYHQIRLQGYRELPDRDYHSKMWHIYQGIAFLVVTIAIHWLSYWDLYLTFKGTVLWLAAGWIGFDLCINNHLDKGWLYVGYDAPTDKFIRWLAEKVNKKPEITGIVLKVVIFLILRFTL